jgi:hypothetical protein
VESATSSTSGILVMKEPFGRRTALGLAAAAGAILLLAPG